VILTVSNPYPKSPPNGQTPGSSGNLGVKSYVKVVDVPNVTIVAPGQLRSDTTVRFGTPISLKASGAIYYSWSPNYNITSLTAKNVTVTPFKNTQYILTGYNGGHCMSSDTLNVFVIEDCGEMYVPNAFSPNGDGHNDVLYVRGLCLKTLSFMVFNRWGEKVFETNDVNVGWDGKYHDEDLNTGVFVYRLEGRTYDGKQYTAKGNVTLIR
jgi:gliding motility-associated-like protein